MSGRLAGRIALVTGASRGIGRAVALRFAQEGATVVALARTTKELESLDDEIRTLTGQSAVLVAESVTDYAKVEQVSVALAHRFKKLDILVGNAGSLIQLSPVTHYTPKQWDEIFSVNVTANWRLLRCLEPLLKASDAGRAIFVTSGAAQSNKPYWGPYAASKAALESLVKVYAAEVAQTNPNLRVNLIDPGHTRTRMRAIAYPGEDAATLPPPESTADTFVALAEPSCTRHGEIVKVQKN
ncbi:MAG: SDR family NAD(P)-dependent oxidoreductase [Rhodospirillaceae bacterium]|nr:SDR family NAD(P)-dependent oxidoreductase [Rhodospirillaceae bacterium]